MKTMIVSMLRADPDSRITSNDVVKELNSVVSIRLKKTILTKNKL